MPVKNVHSRVTTRWVWPARCTPATSKVASPINPLRPNNDLSQTSHRNIKGVSVSEVMRIENMITQMKFY